MLNLTLLNFRKIFLWLQGQGKPAKILYKASAIVLTCVNIITFIADISIIVSNYTGQNIIYIDTVLLILLSAKLPLVLLILILELSLVCFNTHILNNEANQINTRCQRFPHAFASCQMIWFVHRLVNDAIISVVFFVIAPAQTLAIDTLLLTIVGSAIAFVAIIIHRGFDGCNIRLWSFVFCTALNGLMICGLFFVITWAYIIFVDNGLKAAGMGGLILSLIPPLSVSVVGYIIKEKYFKSTSSVNELQEVNETTTIQNGNVAEPQETTPLLQARH